MSKLLPSHASVPASDRYGVWERQWQRSCLTSCLRGPWSRFHRQVKSVRQRTAKQADANVWLAAGCHSFGLLSRFWPELPAELSWCKARPFCG